MNPQDSKTTPETSSGNDQPVNNAGNESAARQPARPASGLAVAAVVLALAAVAAAGYALWQMQSLQALPQQLQSNTGKTARQYSDLERQLENLSAQAGANAATLADLQAALAEEVAAMADVSMQTAALDQRLTAMSGSDATRRKRFLRAEALYYLRIANAQVLLARDSGLGVNALQLADEKLREAGDPDLTPVRARLSEEITALKAVPAIDTTGISFRLQALADQSGDWPLRNPVPDSFEAELTVATAPEQGTWGRLKNTLASVFGSIVSIRQNDAPPDVQLSQTEQTLLVEGMRAELRLARLTLISGNMELYARSLQSLQQQLTAHFDTSAASVSAALETLAELAAVEAPGALPDISASLKLLLAAENQAAADPGSDTQP